VVKLINSRSTRRTIYTLVYTELFFQPHSGQSHLTSKDYNASYQDLHYRYKIKTAVNIAFWWDTPTDTRKRQQLEQALIQKWRSLFNKEMWRVWSQPFGKD